MVTELDLLMSHFGIAVNMLSVLLHCTKATKSYDHVNLKMGT
jgi:hypothetical protein